MFEVFVSVSKISDVFGPFGTCLDAYAHVWMQTDTLGCVWPISENLEKCLYFCVNFERFVMLRCD